MKYIVLFLLLFSIVVGRERSDKEIYDIVKYFLKEHNVTREIIMPNEHNKTVFNVSVSKATIHLKGNIDKTIDIPIVIPQIKRKEESILDRNKTIHQKYYKIIKLKPRGWVIVSTEDIANPILGYSFDSDASDELPLEFQAWLTAINEDIEISKGVTYKDSVALKDTYKRYTYKEPLLKDINLGQKAPYNIYTPIISGEHVPVGCVVTAFAQIMKYYKWPKRSYGSHSYIWNNKRLYANFNISYNYDSDISLAKLSYNLGVAFEMGYGLNGSGTVPTRKRLDRVARSFGYIIPPLRKKANYQKETWDRLIKESIDRGHPIYYQGLSSPTYGGHAFILDGYSYENNVKMYHFNWGWSGYYNGWFTLEPIRGYSLIRFPYSQRAIFNIRPNRAFHPNSSNKASSKKAIITDFTINGNSVYLNIKRDGVSKIQLLVYSYKNNKYIYNRYINRDKIKIIVPNGEKRLKVIVISFDRNGKRVGKYSMNIFVKNRKSISKKAQIKEFINKDNNLYEIKWHRNQAYRVKLIIYSYTLNKYIYQDFVSGNRKIVQIPPNAGEIIIALYSYDKNSRYIDRSYIFKTIRDNQNNHKDLILYPKDNQTIFDKNLTIKINKDNFKNIRLTIYSYKLNRYIFKRVVRSNKIEFIPPNNHDKILIFAEAINNGKVIKKSKIEITFNKIATIKEFKSYKYKDGHAIYIKVDKNGNKNVKLGVYSYTNKRYLFIKDGIRDSYYLFIPKEDRCLVVQLVTYDDSGNYKNQDDRFLSY